MYHSALTEPLVFPVRHIFQSEGNLALQHNILNGITKEFLECDVFYSELAWIAGLKNFNLRAEQEGGYIEYITAVCEFLKLNKPTVLVIGKRERKYLPKAQELRTQLNGAKATAYVFNFEYDDMHGKTTSIITKLAERFQRVGDFCCGYGLTGKIFKQHGKKFTMSDYNSQCIGAISENYINW